MAFRGVLFDAGDTLIRPTGGRWNPRHDFERVLSRHHPEVPTVLERLHERGVRMAVVSDSWSGLAGTFDELGVGHYFETYVISQEMGAVDQLAGGTGPGTVPVSW